VAEFALVRDKRRRGFRVYDTAHFGPRKAVVGRIWRQAARRSKRSIKSSVHIHEDWLNALERRVERAEVMLEKIADENEMLKKALRRRVGQRLKIRWATEVQEEMAQIGVAPKPQP